MEYDLQLRKGGELFTQEWHFEDKCYIEYEISQEDLIFHVHDNVCFGKNITLRDIFLLMSKNVNVFSALTGCPHLSLLIDEALSASDVDGDEKITFLNLERIVTMQKDNIYFNFSFVGLGKDKYYPLEFIPINRLVFCPIILNESFVIEDDLDKIYFKSNKPFTLTEMLNAIVDELSHMGPPGLREFVSDALKKSNEKITHENYRSFIDEDYKNKIKEEREKNKTPCCLCGLDSCSQCFEKPINMCKKCFKKIREN